MGKRQNLIALCLERKQSILAVQETKVPHCGTEDPRNLEEHTLQSTTTWKLYFSSGVLDSDSESLIKAKKKRKPSGLSPAQASSTKTPTDRFAKYKAAVLQRHPQAASLLEKARKLVHIRRIAMRFDSAGTKPRIKTFSEDDLPDAGATTNSKLTPSLQRTSLSTSFKLRLPLLSPRRQPVFSMPKPYQPALSST